MELEPAHDDLFAELLDHGLIEISEEAFDRFATAGWVSIAQALARHIELRQFVTASRMNGALTQGMLDDEAASELHDRVFGDFDSFIPPTSQEAGLYRSAARRAVQRGEKLNIEHVSRIADFAPDHDTVIPLLTAHQDSMGPIWSRSWPSLERRTTGSRQRARRMTCRQGTAWRRCSTGSPRLAKSSS